MRRKNLFLSLICSVLVAVTMISFTVYSLVSTKSNKGQIDNAGTNVSIVGDGNVDPGDEIVIDENINELRDGSEELPYVLFSADNFAEMLSAYGSETQPKRKVVKEQVMVEDESGALVPKYDEQGEPVLQNKIDEDGNLVYEYELDAQGNKIYVPYCFELGKNIDFAGANVEPLFNNGKKFIGTIDGNGFKLKNISISVNAEEFEDKYSHTVGDYRVAHIALFGDVEGATITDIAVEDMSVTVEESVYTYVRDVKYDASKGFYKEIIVGTFAANASDTTFEKVSVKASINGFAYAIYEQNKAAGYNALGGLVAVADGVEVKDSTIDVDIIANTGLNFYVGGVAAYAYETSVENTFVDVSVKSNFAQRLTVAGMFVKADTLTVVDSNVEFVLAEKSATAAERAEYVEGLGTTAHNNNLGKAAGVVVFLTANDDTQKSVFNNVSIVANVDYDCIYAGVIMDVDTTSKTNMELVKLTNVDVNSNVNVLVAYGYARQLIAATVVFNENTTAANITLTGNTKLEKYIVSGSTEQNYSATLFTYKDNYRYLTVDIGTLRFKITTAIAEKLGSTDNLRIKNKTYGAVEY